MLGGPPRPNAVATAEGIMAAPGDVSDEWSDDGGTTSTAPTGGPSKPFGAVALFGQGGVPKLPAVKVWSRGWGVCVCVCVLKLCLSVCLSVMLVLDV